MAWLMQAALFALCYGTCYECCHFMFFSKEIVSGVSIVLGNVVPEMITFLAIFFENGKLSQSLLALLLGLIMRNCEDY